MVEYQRNADAAPQGSEPLNIAIIGVGGAGSNVLDRITLDRSMEAHLVSIHTDVRVLSHAMAPHKIQLGSELMRGVGAGGDPDLGREAALFSRDSIRQALQNQNIIFITVGLGGGTGSGAAPVIAEIAKSTGALVIVVATMPFPFEGRRRVNQAEEALELLQKRADALILFENSRMGELILPKDGIQKAFSAADQLISQSLRAVSTMISTPGLVKLGLDDLTTALTASNGRCLFGFGEARGQNRGADAVKRALKSPLIDQGRLLHQTKNLLVHIAGGETLTLVEVEGIMKQVVRHVPDHTQILFGVAVDNKLGESVTVTLISSLGAEALKSSSFSPPSYHTEPDAPAMAPALEAISTPPPPPSPAPAPAPEPQAKMAPAPAPQPTPQPEPEPIPQAAPQIETAAAPTARQPDPEPEAEPTPEPAPVPQPRLRPPTPKARPEPIAHSEPAPTPPPAPEPPAPAVEPTLDLFAGTNTIIAKSNRGVSSKAIQPDDLPDEIRMEDEPTETPPAVVAPLKETQPIPLPTPKATPKPQPEPEPEPDLEPQPLTPSTTRRTPAPTSAKDDMFTSNDVDRGRFEGTEPSLVGGEDLDIPTWMRRRKQN